MLPSNITIGTRASKLALWQAEHVKDLVESRLSIPVQIKKISTKGDRILDRSLVAIGGKGLFLKEIEDELLSGNIDIAVHSMKDVPHDMPEGLSILAMLEREDPRDVMVSDRFDSFEDLPQGAVVGTTSLRRLVQLKKDRPDLQFKDLRGNVDTRLKKLADGEYDAIILAAAGLKRLGLEDRVTQYLDVVPAIGQGAIGIECSMSNVSVCELMTKLNHEETFRCVGVERLLAKHVNASCQTPIGCYVWSDKASDKFSLKYFYANPNGSNKKYETIEGSWNDVESLIGSLGLGILGS